MIKYLLFIILIQNIEQNESKIYKKGPLLSNNNNIDQREWKSLWFPNPPNYHYDDVTELEKDNVADNGNKNDEWAGTWFPHQPGKSDNVVKSDEGGDSIPWTGTWFPHLPGKQTESDNHECDNGKTNIAIDFDPDDKRHSYNYLCLGNRTEFEPNFNTTTLLVEHLIPVKYEPPVKCLNEKIEYAETLPTFGSYRPLAPKYGSYKYLPPQRWLRSLSDGAIVLLYHPCAFSGQIKQLENILQGCLYRHIITPSQRLTPQRPLALLAWGKCLQMSVVDDNIIVKFIRENAKLGLGGKQDKLKMSSRLYESGLLTESHLVTDEQDSEICGYKEM